MALNKTVLMGRLTADPEFKTLGEDTYVANFRVAVDRDFKNKDGEREADFIPVVAWRGTAEWVCKYFTKGDMIVVEGRLQSRNYTDKDGNNRTSYEVVADNCYFGSSKKDGGNTGAATSQSTAPAASDDSLPF